MEKRYSVFEAKAKLSEIIRLVKSNYKVIITDRGIPAVVVNPYEASMDSEEERFQHLCKSGRIRIATSNKKLAELKPLLDRPEGLKKFLDDR